MIERMIENVKKHENYMNSTINLIASENKLSYLAREALISDYGNRVAEGWSNQRLFPGLKYYNEIEKEGMELIKGMFEADFVDVRPISGTMANMVIYAAFTNPNDIILAPLIKNGGHISMSGATPRKIFRLNVIELPMLKNHINIIDIDRTIDYIRKYKPKLVILGGSVIIKRLDIEKICDVAHEQKSIVVFDASHISGLIIGNQYPNPFHSGVDIITTSTCKTIPGPQHGLILSRKEFSKDIINTTFPSLHSGHHLHHTVSMIITMYEMKIFGKEYALQIRKNINQLGKSLKSHGFNIYEYEENKFSDTHMLMMLINEAEHKEKLLEKAGILINRNIVPWDKNFRQTSGLRIGTPEVTRIGMKEKEMKIIANFIKRLLIDNENPIKIYTEIQEMLKKFNKIKYCFDSLIWNTKYNLVEE